MYGKRGLWYVPFVLFIQIQVNGEDFTFYKHRLKNLVKVRVVVVEGDILLEDVQID